VSAPLPRRGTTAGRLGLLLCALALATIIEIAAARAEPLLLAVARAEAAFDQYTRQPIVTIVLTEAGKTAFAKFTTDNVGHKTEFRTDGRVLMSPVIREPITGGTVQISGSFTAAAAREFASKLSAATARIEVEVVSD
jgi:preprotein translocase subunit SecD